MAANVGVLYQPIRVGILGMEGGGGGDVDSTRSAEKLRDAFLVIERILWGEEDCREEGYRW